MRPEGLGTFFVKDLPPPPPRDRSVGPVCKHVPYLSMCLTTTHKLHISFVIKHFVGLENIDVQWILVQVRRWFCCSHGYTERASQSVEELNAHQHSSAILWNFSPIPRLSCDVCSFRAFWTVFLPHISPAFTASVLGNQVTNRHLSAMQSQWHSHLHTCTWQSYTNPKHLWRQGRCTAHSQPQGKTAMSVQQYPRLWWFGSHRMVKTGSAVNLANPG
jgi:hypothetical protein